MPTDDLARILRHITYVPERTELTAIPWPDGLAPEAAETALTGDGSLPEADVLVITWTSAEATALADVLTPGAPWSGWVHYAKDLSEYAPRRRKRSGWGNSTWRRSAA